MKLGTAIAEIMKREGIEILCGYPVNHLIEHAANANIRPIMVRQERIGIHMADAISRVTSGERIGAFCMQHGPGAENAMGGVAQCYGESVPVLILPQGYPRRIANIDPNFNSSQAMKAYAKSSEPIGIAGEVCNIFRRAFTRLKNGRGGPVIVEIPTDMWNEEVAEPLNYTPVLRTRYGADPAHIKEAAKLLVNARRPVLYAGQGVHYAKAWPQLKRLAERLAIPVTTSLGGKSSFPETHPLSLGQPLQLRPCLGVMDALAGINHRTLGVDEQCGRLLDMGGVGAIAGAQDRRVVQRFRHLLVPHVGGDLDDDRAAAAVLQFGEGAAENVADLVGDNDRLGGLGVGLHRLAGVEIRVDVCDPPRVALRQHQHGDGLAVALRDAAHGVLRAGAMLHAESPDGAARGDARDRIRHVHADALLPHHDGPDIGVGCMFDQVVDRIAAEDLDPLALHDFRDRSAELHGRLSLMRPIVMPGLSRTGRGTGFGRMVKHAREALICAACP
jgi:hypothetical protein